MSETETARLAKRVTPRSIREACCVQYAVKDHRNRPDSLVVRDPLVVVRRGRFAGDWVGRDADGQEWGIPRSQVESGRFRHLPDTKSAATTDPEGVVEL